MPEEIYTDVMCPKCGGGNVTETVTNKSSGCLSVLFYGILICLPVVGWITLVFLMIGRKDKLIYNYMCRDCRKTWTVNPNAKKEKIGLIIAIAFLILISLLLPPLLSSR